MQYTYGEVVGVGAFAVEKFADYCRAQGFQVDDVQTDNFFRTLDVDLVVHDGNGDNKLVEVKGDRYKTGNIYIERVSNSTKNTPGCLMYTCADVVAYYFVKKGEAVMIPVKKLREWIPENLHKYPEKRVGSKGRKGELWFEGIGHIVPVKTIISELGAEVIEGLPTL